VRLCLNGKKLGRVVSPCLPSNSKKLKIAGSQSRLAWAKRETPISKITRGLEEWLRW
jgi:hypothetical protein